MRKHVFTMQHNATHNHRADFNAKTCENMYRLNIIEPIFGKIGCILSQTCFRIIIGSRMSQTCFRIMQTRLRHYRADF